MNLLSFLTLRIRDKLLNIKAGAGRRNGDRRESFFHVCLRRIESPMRNFPRNARKRIWANNLLSFLALRIRDKLLNIKML